MEKISVFAKSNAREPIEEMSIRAFVKAVKNGKWKGIQTKVRKAKTDEERKKLKKFRTPGVTISGTFERREGKPTTHSRFICIDLDSKDNPEILEKVDELEDDPYVCAIFKSISGTGLALIFKIMPKKHAELFLGIEKYLKEEYDIIVDPSGKDQARLRYVSYDPDTYYDFTKDEFDRPIKVKKLPTLPVDDTTIEDVEKLVKEIENREADIVPDYDSWYKVGQALATLGEPGRELYHRISSLGESYSKRECDKQFEACLTKESKGLTDKKINISTLFFLAAEEGIKPRVPQFKKKPKKKRKEGEDQPSVAYLSLEGTKMGNTWSYHIWAFKVAIKKDDPAVVICSGISGEGLSSFLYTIGIRKGNDQFYHIHGTIVERVTFDYVADLVIKETKKVDKDFAIMWDEESSVVTREALLNAVHESVKQFLSKSYVPAPFDFTTERFLKDTKDHTYLFYNNGVVVVGASGYRLREYTDYEQYVWKDSIHNRDFTESDKKSVVQEILQNAIGKENWTFVQSAIGYMVNTFIPGAGAPILFCMDKNIGDLNEGGNGKDFFMQILKSTRKTAKLDGRTMDFKDKFNMSGVDESTQVVWINDLDRSIQMHKLYNLIDGVSVRKLYKDTFHVKAKVGISLQHFIDMEGNSDKRRQIILTFNDFYLRKGGIGGYHKDNDIFGDNWKDWAAYDTMMARACVYYHKHGIQKMDISDLIDARREDLESTGGYGNLERNKWYGLKEAAEECMDNDYGVTKGDIYSFKHGLARWAKAHNPPLVIELGRVRIDGKQQKSFRLVSQMKFEKGGKVSK